MNTLCKLTYSSSQYIDHEYFSVVSGEIIMPDSSIKKFSIGISNEQSCCEDFGVHVRLSGQNLDLVENDNLIRDPIKISSSPRWAYANTNSSSEDNFADVVIETEKGKLEIELYNNHNGYYSHTIFYEYDGYKDTQSL